MCAVVAYPSLLVGGIIDGISALLVKHPPVLLLAVADYFYLGGLTDGEREGIITERLMAIETVHAVRILEHRPHSSMDVEVRMEDPDQEPDRYRDIQHAWDGASSPWNTFPDPVKVACEVLSLEK